MTAAEMKEAEQEYEEFKPYQNQQDFINLVGSFNDVFVIWMRNAETGW